MIVCVCLEYPDGPMKIIACLARFSLAKDCDAIAPDAAKGIKSRERRRRKRSMYFLFICAACRFAAHAALARKITKHTRGAFDVLRGCTRRKGGEGRGG